MNFARRRFTAQGGSGVAAPPRSEPAPGAGVRVRAPRDRLSLRANFSWVSVGRGVFAVSQWGMLAVLAKVATVQMVGEFTLALAIGAPIFKFANLGLRHVQATDVRGENSFGDYLGLRHWTNVAALLFLACLASASGYGAETALVILLVGLTKAVAAASEVYYARFQASERMDYVARSLMLRGPLTLFALALGVYLSGQLALGVLGQVLASLLVLYLYDRPMGRRSLQRAAAAQEDGEEMGPGGLLRPSWDLGVARRLAWKALPLGIAAMLVSLSLNVPRYFIADQLGLEALGFFAAMLYVLVAANQFMMALGHSASARLARLYANGEKRRFVVLLAKMGSVGLVIGLAGVGAVALFGGRILTLLYTPEYAEYAGVFTLIMCAALIRYVASLLQFGVTAARRFRIQVVHYAAVTLAALIASACLIGPYGLIGAGLVTLIATAVDLLGTLVINVWSIRQLDPIRR